MDNNEDFIVTAEIIDVQLMIKQQKFTNYYQELFKVFVAHSKNIERVTFWGVTDRESWLNGWPIRGRTNYPLLFNRDGSAKPALDAIIKIVK